jgi:rfaE bifunctional protein kinase chain/domain/rfaE bifunctional protein nucleotidyltransferase chain/domain
MKTVFTNGCFDLFHPGHVDLLERARSLGDRLVVGLNSDASVRALKGPGRPLVPQEERALMLRSLRSVDEVIIFDEPTPARLIEELAPDVLVKGEDWAVDQIVGAEGVLRRGGRVVSLPVRLPYSTSALVERIMESAHPLPAAARPGSPEAGILDSFQGRRVLVLGDIMLDRYWIGSVSRISPEAPVPIINKRNSTLAPGGAGNVAANIASLGGIPILVGTVGDDEAGRELRGILEKRGIDLAHLAIDPARPTTIKTRIIAQNQQVVRVDDEETQPIGPSLAARVADTVRSLLREVDLLVISDYAKGLILPALAGRVIRLANELHRRVIVDSKAADYSSFKGAYLLTPNRAEAARAAGVSADRPDGVSVAGARLLETLAVAAVLITQSEAGMTLFEKDREPVHFPTLTRTVYDVTGAGDTVVATISLALAGGASLPVTAQLANLAAGIVVEQFGTSAITAGQLRRALLDSCLQTAVANGEVRSEGTIRRHKALSP